MFNFNIKSISKFWVTWRIRYKDDKVSFIPINDTTPQEVCINGVW